MLAANPGPSSSDLGALPDSITDPLQHLVACHERIEEHLQLLERSVSLLSSPEEETRAEGRKSLDQALQFLKTMGELHTQDEEQSLFPRLRANLGDDLSGLGELMALLESQHREKEGVYEELAACVNAFPPAPEAPSVDQISRCRGLTAQLTDIYRPHIMIENERLIPLSAEHLPESAWAEMRQEMRTRFGL